MKNCFEMKYLLHLAWCMFMPRILYTTLNLKKNNNKTSTNNTTRFKVVIKMFSFLIGSFQRTPIPSPQRKLELIPLPPSDVLIQLHECSSPGLLQLQSLSSLQRIRGLGFRTIKIRCLHRNL
jgi:hypothetical protein